MLAIAAPLRAWLRDGRGFAVATVAATRGSAPRGPGAALAVDGAGTVLGSVSGGCVEAEVYERCRQALADGVPRTARFGPEAADPFGAALTCGGGIEVLITPAPPGGAARLALGAAAQRAAAGRPGVLVRVLRAPGTPVAGALALGSGGDRTGTLGRGPAFDEAAARAAAAAAAARVPATTVRAGDATLLVETSVPPPRLLVFGSTDVAAALAEAGRFLGYRVTVCDARPVFTTPERFPAAHETVVAWPHRYLAAERDAGRLDDRTAVCALTHDPRTETPLLALALRLPLGYVGALGSRRTHAARLRRLRAEGIGSGQLARLRAPVGLDLGGHTPRETALAVVAELTALRHGGSGVPLTRTTRPLHRR